MIRLSAILLVGTLVFGAVGCTNMNKTQQAGKMILFDLDYI